MSERPRPRLVRPDPEDPQDPLSSMLGIPEMETSAMHPIEVWLDREFLIRSLENSIETIRAKAEGNHDFEYRRYVRALIQQRIDFLEGLKQLRDPQVYVAMYRPDEELREAELDDVTNDHPDDLIF